MGLHLLEYHNNWSKPTRGSGGAYPFGAQAPPAPTVTATLPVHDLCGAWPGGVGRGPGDGVQRGRTQARLGPLAYGFSAPQAIPVIMTITVPQEPNIL